MRAFEVHLNDERLCVAGLEGGGVLNTMLDHVIRGGAKEELHLRVGGLERATGEHLTWVNTRLQVGDKVTVRIVETDSVDGPLKRQPIDPGPDDRK